MNMNSENTNLSRSSSQVMELQDLIAGPLMATIEADALSSQKYLGFLLKLAFESYDPKTGKTGNLRLLTFQYNEQTTEGVAVRSISIPFLTLVPLPLLQIQEANFDFDIKILDALTTVEEESFSIESGQRIEGKEKPTALKMRASLAPKSGKSSGELQQSLAANMKVNVKMRQADMPAGLSNLLHLAANNVVP